MGAGEVIALEDQGIALCIVAFRDMICFSKLKLLRKLLQGTKCLAPGIVWSHWFEKWINQEKKD